MAVVRAYSRRGGTAQLLRYALKQEKILNKEGKYVLVTRNLRSKSIDGYIEEFQLNHMMRSYTRKNGLECYHTTISWSYKDADLVTEQVMRDMASKFMSLRSRGSLFLSIGHFNTDSPHLHIIHSATSLNGKSARISREEFANLKIELDAYQNKRWPELIHSLPDHGKAKRLKTIPEKSAYKNRRTPLDIQKIQKWLDKAYEKAHSREEFISSVEAVGLEIYSRNNRLQGVKFKGLKHRFSKYGITQEMFQHLDEIEQKETKMLQEIESIRSQKSYSREIDYEYDDGQEHSRDEPHDDEDEKSEVNDNDEEYTVDDSEEEQEDSTDDDDDEQP